MDLNLLSPIMGIPVVTEIEASITSNSKSPALVFLPSNYSENYLATFGWPLYMF